MLSTLATSQHQRSLLAGGRGRLDAFTDGYQLAFLIGAGLCLRGAVAAVTLLRRRSGIGAAGEPEPA